MNTPNNQPTQATTNIDGVQVLGQYRYINGELSRKTRLMWIEQVLSTGRSEQTVEDAVVNYKAQVKARLESIKASVNSTQVTGRDKQCAA